MTLETSTLCININAYAHKHKHWQQCTIASSDTMLSNLSKKKWNRRKKKHFKFRHVLFEREILRVAVKDSYFSMSLHPSSSIIIITLCIHHIHPHAFLFLSFSFFFLLSWKDPRKCFYYLINVFFILFFSSYSRCRYVNEAKPGHFVGSNSSPSSL